MIIGLSFIVKITTKEKETEFNVINL
jgi:hypothetical protein